jgi:hypothetical protein
MDETEITNSEYRQFVEWVKDSTMRALSNTSRIWMVSSLETEKVKKVAVLVI